MSAHASTRHILDNHEHQAVHKSNVNRRITKYHCRSDPDQKFRETKTRRPRSVPRVLHSDGLGVSLSQLPDDKDTERHVLRRNEIAQKVIFALSSFFPLLAFFVLPPFVKEDLDDLRARLLLPVPPDDKQQAALHLLRCGEGPDHQRDRGYCRV